MKLGAKMSIISFQGLPGAYSHLVCKKYYPNFKTLPCENFEDTFKAVEMNKADLAMIPIENSTAGRVSDIHFLIQNTKLKIVAEYYQKIEHCLLSNKNTKLNDIKKIYSHEQAILQCRNTIKKYGVKTVNYLDTAGAAKLISQSKDKSKAAIASSLAAEIYGLEIKKKQLQDKQNNTTRFLVFSKKSIEVSIKKKVRTTLVFKTKNVPAGLYMALGGFANNGINLSRLESFFVNEQFKQSWFIVDVDCHPELKSFKKAIMELKKYSLVINILGHYEAANLITKK